MPAPIFVVDSSPAVRRMVEQISGPEGYEVVGFQDGPAALEAARTHSPSLIIADYHLENMTFSGFCKEINKLDNLTETMVISLINPADHPDEKHLRTLGVKAFVKKPFQSEELLEALKSVQQKPVGTSTGNGFKRRAWPPTSTSIDSETDEPIVPILGTDETEDTMPQHDASPISAPLSPVPNGDPQDAMKGLFDQLLQSMTKQTEKRLADQLPQAIEGRLEGQVRPMIQKEVQSQLGNILSEEYLTTIIQPLLSQAIPALLKKELAASEPTIRQSLSDLLGTSIKASLAQQVREQVDFAVRQTLPSVVRDHLGTIDHVVKDEVHNATLKHIPLLADELVRTTTEQTVERAVQHIVPELAEKHIKAEINRLLETEAIPNASTS